MQTFLKFPVVLEKINIMLVLLAILYGEAREDPRQIFQARQIVQAHSTKTKSRTIKLKNCSSL